MRSTHATQFELPNVGAGPDPFAPSEIDADADVADEFDQPVRFGLLGKVHDFVGRMPAAVVLDPESGEVAYEHEGDTYGDRPDVDELLSAVESR